MLIECSKNTFACKLMDGNISDDKYKVVDDIIYYKDKIYLVPESKMKEWILKEDTCTNIVKPTPNGNLVSINGPPNEQVLPMVNQIHGDASDDSLREQPQFVEYGVFPSVVNKAYMTAIFPCEGLPHTNNMIYISCEVPKEIGVLSH